MLLARADSATRLDGGATLAFSSANHYRYTLAVILDLAGKSTEAVSLLQEALTNDVGLYMAHVRLAGISMTSILAGPRRSKNAAAPWQPIPRILPPVPTGGSARPRRGAGRGPGRPPAGPANPRNVRALYVLGFVARQMDTRRCPRRVQPFIELAPSRFEDQKVEARKRIEAMGS